MGRVCGLTYMDESISALLSGGMAFLAKASFFCSQPKLEGAGTHRGVQERTGELIMKRTNLRQVVVAMGIAGMGWALVACGGGESEGPVVPPPPAPAEYADKHMPAGWWADAAKMEEGRKLFIGETNPDVNCASCHGKDGKDDSS